MVTTAQYFNDFTLVQSGDYTVPSYIIDTAIEATNGQVTVTETSHGLDQGDDLEIIKADSPLNLFCTTICQSCRSYRRKHI